MRALVVVPLLLILALPAAAQQTAAPDPAPAPAPPSPPRSSPPSSITPVQVCRAACSKTYYFCLAGLDQTECSPHWAACLTRCGH